MITGIAIENFKGIGDRIEIPIKPLTFLLKPPAPGVIWGEQYAIWSSC